MLKRKVDEYLAKWKENPNRLPLIIKGARQIGKTTSIRQFGKTYSSFIEINFLLNPEYRSIFKNGFDVDGIVKEMSFLEHSFKFIEGNTLILFDEIQSFPECMTSLKSFAEDGRYDVICSGSLLGVNYKKISSIPVGFKEEYQMYSIDFEEYLWAMGYSAEQIEVLFGYMKEIKPIPESIHEKMKDIFKSYIFVGGMPRVVSMYAKSGIYSEDIFKAQSSINSDYEDDMSKYVDGLDGTKIKKFYKHIKTQLAKDNHKFQVTTMGHGNRQRDYEGVEEWLLETGIINIAYNLKSLDIPFDGNEDPNNFRIYYAEHSLYMATLDEEDKKELVRSGNYDIYNGALYESLASEALVKEGYNLYFFKNQDATTELDFLIRCGRNIIPIEVKKNNGRSKSLNAVINDKKNQIKLGIKFTDGNIGRDDTKITFPLYLIFLLRRFAEETDALSI